MEEIMYMSSEGICMDIQDSIDVISQEIRRLLDCGVPNEVIIENILEDDDIKGDYTNIVQLINTILKKQVPNSKCLI